MTKYLQFLQNQLELIAGYKAQTEFPLLAVRYMNTVVELLILQFSFNKIWNSLLCSTRTHMNFSFHFLPGVFLRERDVDSLLEPSPDGGIQHPGDVGGA